METKKISLLAKMVNMDMDLAKDFKVKEELQNLIYYMNFVVTRTQALSNKPNFINAEKVAEQL